MAQRIWLIRHGKSARPFGIVDHQRPLAARASNDAALIRNWLNDAGKDAPSVFITSTALRAAETARLVAGERPVHTHDELYQATPASFLDVIEEALVEGDSVALVGHNPTVTLLVNQLAGKVVAENVPTLGVATFSRESASARWSLVDYVVPKQLR